jgi:hypothetical protein
MIDKLTPEQEAKIPEYLQKYYDKVYRSQPIDRNMCEESITYIYKQAGYKAPYVWYVESPLMAQIVANLLTNKDYSNLESNLRSNLRNNLWSYLESNLWSYLESNLESNLGSNLRNNLRSNLANNLWNNLRSNLESNLANNLRNNLRSNLESNLGSNLANNLWNNLRSNLRSNLESNLANNLWNNLGSNLRSNLESNLRSNLRSIDYITTAYYGNLSDYGWTCFYDFINNELMPSYNLELWNKWKDLINSNIYDMIQFDGLCIVMAMPEKVNIDTNKRLHSETSCAVSWKDGYEIYAWHGLIIPKEWIENKKSITKEIIAQEGNAERRRCIQEILGGEAYLSLLDVSEVDKDFDAQGNEMILYQTKKVDEAANEHIYYLKVTCPSTGRNYFLCVPESKNVWDAKAWTFNNQKIYARHGDIGLLDLKKEFKVPVYES